MTITPAMQASPPEITENEVVLAAATEPASRSPRRGPPCTTAIWIDERRLRNSSGTVVWRIVLRRTADTTSAQPAIASSSSASQNAWTKPKTVIDAPHSSTATITPTPCRRNRPTQPEPTEPMKAPTPGAE